MKICRNKDNKESGRRVLHPRTRLLLDFFESLRVCVFVYFFPIVPPNIGIPEIENQRPEKSATLF